MSKFERFTKTVFLLSLASIAVCLLLLTYFFYFVLQPNPAGNLIKHEALRNKNVVEVKILESESDAPFWKINAEIQTADNQKIRLHCVTWPLVSKKVYVSQINDIQFFDGRTFEIRKKDTIFYEPNDSEVLGKMLGIKLKSVNDIVKHSGELYDLYKQLAENTSAEKEFVYKGRFRIKADFGNPGWARDVKKRT